MIRHFVEHARLAEVATGDQVAGGRNIVDSTGYKRRRG